MKIVLLAWMREIVRAPLQSSLSIVGVALGITAFTAVNVANHSASESFLAASAAMTESATHTIAGGPGDQLYRQIRLTTGFSAQPIVQGRVRVADADSASAIIYGIDPVAYFQFDDGSGAAAAGSQNFSQLLAESFSAFATADTLHRLGADVGDRIRVRHGQKHFELHITGLLETSTPLQEQSYRLLFLTDIATAQTVLGMRGRLSSIQLQLPQDEQAVQQIENLLPRGVELEGNVNRQRSMASITEAFQTNLTAMSLLALLVAIFLIYNTMTYLVMRRRPTIEILRALGVSSPGITICLILEAAFIGLAASVIGYFAGAQLAKILLTLVERSINNLYFPIDAGITILSPSAFLLALALGIGSTLLATLPALREALLTKPAFGTTHRRTLRGRRRRTAIFLIASAVFVLLGIAMMRLHPTSVVLGFASIYLIVAGCFCLVPILCRILGRFLRAASKQLFGVRGVLASRGLAMAGGRTSIAICALCIAISATIGVGVMISSFRTAVDGWLSDRISADVYVSTQGHGDQLSGPEIDRLKEISGVESVGVANWTWLQGPEGRSRLFAVDYGEQAFRGYRFISQAPDVWERFQEDGVIISEPYAWKHGVTVGDPLEFWRGADAIRMPVLGVFVDYSSDRGVVMMHREVFVSKFEDQTITTAALFGQTGSDTQAILSAAEELIASPGANLWSASGLHEASMEVFDQTFAITAVLRSLAVVVAIIAVVSILAMIQIDRGSELRVQNAIGYTAREIWASACIESGVLGFIAGVLSIPVGLILTWLLIWVVNQRSFGWTMQMLVDSSILIEAVMLAVIAALLAGIVPAWWLASKAPRQTLAVE